MFSFFKSIASTLPERYYQFCFSKAQLGSKTRIYPIDFTQSWTRIALEQKFYLIMACVTEVITYTFFTLTPLFIGSILVTRNYWFFSYLCLGWLVAIVCEYITMYLVAIIEVQVIQSIHYNSYEFFLTVDPIYHAKKASGKLFAKIDRGARSYEDFIDIIMFDLLPTLVSTVTVIGSCFWAHRTLGFIALIILILVATFDIVTNLLTGPVFQKKLIEIDDRLKTTTVESLTQIQLVRSCFASTELAQQVYTKNKEMMATHGTIWIAGSTSAFLVRAAYLISVVILGLVVLNKINVGALDVLTGTTLLITYIRGTYEIIKIGRKIRKFIKCTVQIKDLYTFIPNFGVESFPVLPDKNSTYQTLPVTDTITLSAENLSFSYDQSTPILHDHSLILSLPKNSSPKLFGIIGPSGVGKTTLLSILGGQLNPLSGSVVINSVNMYETDETTRRQLVAIQGQAASNLSGTLRNSLLLGLPQDTYSDAAMIAILESVGLWSLLQTKQGLDTSIGESGFTLSGGQRQRLNFASLYLRAHYYKPAVILIDEPTSSLDQISEQAITHMIEQLATTAITCVIAHRLKTIESAVGIFDISLLDQEKEIKFYTHHELATKSTYYQELIKGTAALDA